MIMSFFSSFVPLRTVAPIFGAFFLANAHAGVYLGVGVGQMLSQGRYTIQDSNGADITDNWYATPRIGWRFHMPKGFTAHIEARHRSSVQNNNDGGNNFGEFGLEWEWR